jgi:hypothetical protein
LLQIPVSLTPPIFRDDIGERDTAHRPEPGHGVADRQQGIAVGVGRQAECGLRFPSRIELLHEKRAMISKVEFPCRNLDFCTRRVIRFGRQVVRSAY